MNSNTKKRMTKALGLASAFAFGMLLLVGTQANAQNRDYRDDIYQSGRIGDRDYGNSRIDKRQIRAAYDRGFQVGFQEGIREGRERGRFGNNRGYGSGYGNNASWGNYGGYGNNYKIQEAFQKGFRKGFAEGFKRARQNRRGNNWPF
jgi:hypothetical protein